MAGQRPLRFLKSRYDHHYLVPQQRIPGYLPYPNPVAPGNVFVPNASSVDWPQAQFAPPWLPPGSASFSPYQYPNYADDQLLAGTDDLVLDNPVYIDTTQLMWMAAAATLGYFAAKKGWDHQLRTFVKSKL